MPIWDKIFGGGAAVLVEKVGNVIDNVVTTKEEKMQLENEIKKAEQEFQVEMKKLSIEEQQQVYQDLASARQRELTIQTSQYGTKLGKNTASFLALGTTILTFALFYLVIFYWTGKRDLQEGQKEVVIYILGVLSAIVTQIFSYYFGSSAGSAKKSEMIEQELKKKL